VKAFRTRFLRVGRSRDNTSRDQRLGIENPPSGVEQERELESHFPLQNNSTAPNEREIVVDGQENNFEGNDIALWADGMTYENFSDDWMCLPLDAFDPGFMDPNNGLGATGLDFFRTA
jgi:hypothetical protein